MKQNFTAKTIEEAKEMAVTAFGVVASKITFEIIEEPKKGLFGKIKGEAVVSAFYEPTKAELVCSYIKKMLEKMEISDVTVAAAEVEDGIAVEISGEEFEEMLGKKGELLDSIQYLSSLIINKGDKDFSRVNVNCNGFREKREKWLTSLAEKVCKTVAKTGRSSVLEPMNPYERRIIHSAVSEMQGVKSHSVGDDPYRKVVVTSLDKRNRRNVPSNRRSFDDKKSNGERPNRDKNFVPKPRALDISTSFEKDYKKPRPDDSVGSGLYSKIDI